MTTPKWTLAGSTDALESLRVLVLRRLFWAECTFTPTDDPTVWTVANALGERPNWRVKYHKGRYRLEVLRGAP
jgi:hypothetical protein